MTITKTQRTFLKMLLTIGSPILLQEVLHQGVNMLDTMMIGRSMDEYHVTAVGLAGQIFFLFILFTFGVLSASSVFSGQYNGAGDIKSIRKIMGLAFSGSSFVAFLFFVPSFFFGEVVISIYTDNPYVIAMGASFLRIVCGSFFIVAILSSRNMAMRSMGQTRIPLFCTAIAFFANMVFNYLAIFHFGFGIYGVAVGTVFSRVIELIFQEILIRKYNLPIRAKFSEYFNFDFAFVKAFLKIGVFIIINEMLWALGISSYQIAYGIVGVEAQGAIQMSLAIANIFQIFSNAIAITTGVIITNTIGNKKIKLSKIYSQYCIIFTIVTTILMGGILILFSSLIASFYNVGYYITADIQRILVIAGATMLLRGMNFTIIVGILRSGSDAPFCFKVEMATVYLIGLPIAFGSAFLGMPIWLIYALIHLEELIKLVIVLFRYRSGKWAREVI